MLAALRRGLMVDPERGPFGGVPVALVPDNGLEFATTALAKRARRWGPCNRSTPHVLLVNPTGEDSTMTTTSYPLHHLTDSGGRLRGWPLLADSLEKW